MMHGHEKSDSVIVAAKPVNKAEQSAAEPVEPRAGTKGNASQQSTHRTQSRVSVSQALDRMRQAFAVVTRGRSRETARASTGVDLSHCCLHDARPQPVLQFVRIAGGLANLRLTIRWFTYLR
jgi:hypothetical protein